MGRFLSNIHSLIDSIQPSSIHEIGCGEGHLSRILCRYQAPIMASDFSQQIIDIASSQQHIEGCRIEWKVASIYELTPEADAANLIVCCEVLEHLPGPEEALAILIPLSRPYLIVSVPREPLWRSLNMLCGKYLRHGGNTPGHLNHWGKSAFVSLVGRYFDIIKVRSPLPWTMLLCRRNS